MILILLPWSVIPSLVYVFVIVYNKTSSWAFQIRNTKIYTNSIPLLSSSVLDVQGTLIFGISNLPLTSLVPYGRPNPFPLLQATRTRRLPSSRHWKTTSRPKITNQECRAAFFFLKFFGGHSVRFQKLTYQKCFFYDFSYLPLLFALLDKLWDWFLRVGPLDSLSHLNRPSNE